MVSFCYKVTYLELVPILAVSSLHGWWIHFYNDYSVLLTALLHVSMQIK